VAFGRLSQNRGGTPIDGRLPYGGAAVPEGTAEEPCVCRRFASDSFSFFRSFLRHPCRSFACTALPPAFGRVASAWTTGIGVQRTPFCERLCPAVTTSECGVGIARALSRAARTGLHFPLSTLGRGREPTGPARSGRPERTSVGHFEMPAFDRKRIKTGRNLAVQQVSCWRTIVCRTGSVRNA
jgi:hypothetical protein